MRHYVYIISCVLSVLLFSACEHKELCLDHSHIVSIEVVFDWRKAPEAAPATMSLYMYPEEGGESMRFEFTDYHGGTIRIPIGKYKAFCINSDTEVIRYRNIKAFETFEMITRNTSTLMNLHSLGLTSESAPRAPGTEEERVAFSPDRIWSDRMELVEINGTDEHQVITFYPENSICNYTVEVRDAENLKYVRGLSGSLSSMTEGFLPGTNKLGADRVTIPFDATYSTEAAAVFGALRTFGHCYETSIDHTLIIYAVMSDGGKYYYTFDVTNQIHTAPDQRNVHIIVYGLPLPKPITNGGGLHPEISDWESVDVEIKM